MSEKIEVFVAKNNCNLIGFQGDFIILIPISVYSPCPKSNLFTKFSCFKDSEYNIIGSDEFWICNGNIFLGAETEEELYSRFINNDSNSDSLDIRFQNEYLTKINVDQKYFN
jgi:hypothetical protein